MSTIAKRPGKLIRKKILVPLLGMGVAVSWYHTGRAARANESVAVTAPGVSQSQTPPRPLWNSHSWYGFPYSYYNPENYNGGGNYGGGYYGGGYYGGGYYGGGYSGGGYGY